MGTSKGRITGPVAGSPEDQMMGRPWDVFGTLVPHVL